MAHSLCGSYGGDLVILILIFSSFSLLFCDDFDQTTMSVECCDSMNAHAGASQVASLLRIEQPTCPLPALALRYAGYLQVIGRACFAARLT